MIKLSKTSIFQLLILNLVLTSFLSVEFGLMWILFGVLFLGSKCVLNRKIFFQYSFTNLMIAYLIWLFIVTQCSQIPTASQMMLVILAGLPVTYLISTNIETFSKCWSNVRIFLFIIAISFSLWGIWQVYAQIGRGHAVGPLSDRNAFAALLNLFWFPSTYLLVSKVKNFNNWSSSFVSVGMFIISTSFFATTSRGGILIWFVLLPVLLWVVYKHTKSVKLILFIPAIAIAGYFTSALLLNANVVERSIALSQDPSTTSRFDMWSSAFSMIFSHPVVGTGWGTWSNFYPVYRAITETQSAGYFAHNDYLQFADEGGVIALLLLLFSLINLLMLLKKRLKSEITDSVLESTTLILGVLAIFMHAGINFIFYFSIMNVVAGLYLARAVQTTEIPRNIYLPQLNQIRVSIKNLVFCLILMYVAMPYLLHQLAVFSFYDGQPALKTINILWPRVTVQNIANVIVALRPQNNLAQDALLQTSEYYLNNAAELGLDENHQRQIAKEAINRFDQYRTFNANNPNMGLREVDMLLRYKSLFDDDFAYTKSHQILTVNLQVNPHHVKSMIATSRLLVAENYRKKAIAFLQQSITQVLGRHDQQLLVVELLRQRAAPKSIPELNEIEKDLDLVISASEQAAYIKLPTSYYEEIDARLLALDKSISAMTNE